MKKIGITGNIASGKSTVEKIIAGMGFSVIDADKICHYGLENNIDIINAVRELFSGYAIIENGKINRSAIAKIVFSDFSLKTALEKILHPFVRDEVQKFFEKNKNDDLVFVSAALLFEAGMGNDFDFNIFVSAPDDIRLARLMSRNNLTQDEAKKRLSAQKPQEEKIALADFVINNGGTIEELKNNTQEVLKLLH